MLDPDPETARRRHLSHPVRLHRPSTRRHRRVSRDHGRVCRRDGAVVQGRPGRPAENGVADLAWSVRRLEGGTDAGGRADPGRTNRRCVSVSTSSQRRSKDEHSHGVSTQLGSIGDVHGQYYDFLHLLSLTGKPSPTHTLVFNGDLVDRGSWSTEILLTVLAYKCESPYGWVFCRVAPY
jgi:hypothetical protein